MIIQFTGMSGSGKTTLAQRAKTLLQQQGYKVEIIDGDEYRKALCSDLGFSKIDRQRNIRRLAFVANKLSQHGVIAVICAINPYEDIRNEVNETYGNVKTVFVDCELDTLIDRDTKGLYKKALLPDGHPEKITNLTGINDPYEVPPSPDLHICTGADSVDVSVSKLLNFILQIITTAPLV